MVDLKRFIIRLALLYMLILLVFCTAQAEEPAVVFIDSAGGTAGEVLDTHIGIRNISSLGGSSISGGEFELVYDANHVELEDIIKGPLIGDNFLFIVNDEYSGNSIKVAWAAMRGSIKEDGILLNVSFKLKVDGDISLIIQDLLLYDENVKALEVGTATDEPVVAIPIYPPEGNPENDTPGEREQPKPGDDNPEDSDPPGDSDTEKPQDDDSPNDIETIEPRGDDSPQTDANQPENGSQGETTKPDNSTPEGTDAVSPPDEPGNTDSTGSDKGPLDSTDTGGENPKEGPTDDTPDAHEEIAKPVQPETNPVSLFFVFGILITTIGGTSYYIYRRSRQQS